MSRRVTTQTQPLGRAQGVTVYGGEEGFELYIDTDQGRYVINVHACSENLLEEVEREIGAYWEEHRSAMAGAKIVADDADAYDLDDPKHPDFHSVHADLWDTMKNGSVADLGRMLRPTARRVS